MEKQLGFGCMRLPMKDNEVDYEEFNKMIDLYMDNGFTYFDTAHGYLQGKSETAIRDCLVARYPRESYVLTNKLSVHFFNKEEDILPLFEEQLKACGVDYFDYYLMHAQDKEIYKHFTKCHAYQTALKLKEAGKIKHLGISFHDTADVLEMILKEHPEIEVVQIQFNYKDYLDPSVQSKQVYEVARKYQKPVLVMEPIKGGGLVNLPEEAKKVFDNLDEDLSYASYALRFAASQEGVYKVLSGMSQLEQMKDNISFMKDFKPLNEKEYQAIDQVVEILNQLGGIGCTACRYCTDGCPQKISIPDLFACYNAKKQFNDWNSDYYYGVHTKNNGKASDCIGCGQCEGICPQHLPIIELLKEVSTAFEK
ncbi:MAG: aldo/keto reductase [Coprobacillus cateniformis]|uniref:aldo/keto reductase n=1 Tax=Longibaculum muris TaxID=1796628 RepID=UPI003AB58A50|nr:aldo/keto reductase [Coprobacillus cateniformis]